MGSATLRGDGLDIPISMLIVAGPPPGYIMEFIEYGEHAREIAFTARPDMPFSEQKVRPYRLRVSNPRVSFAPGAFSYFVSSTPHSNLFGRTVNHVYQCPEGEILSVIFRALGVDMGGEA